MIILSKFFYQKNLDKFMKKLLVIIFILGILGYLAHLWTENMCRDVVKKLNLTGTEAKVKYEECLRW